MDWSLVLKFLVPLGTVIAIAIYLVECKGADTKIDVQGSAHDPHSTCSLCSRFKSEVGSMVAGEAGSLCSDCLINSALLLDDASKNNNKEVRFIHRLLIATLSKSCESAHCDESLKNYILEAGAVNPEQRSQILTIANSHANASFIIDFLNQIPKEHWTFDDIIFWMYANFNEGNYGDSLNHPEVKRENCTDAEYRLFTLNRIAANIEIGAESEEILNNLADLDSIRRFYGTGDYPHPLDERLVLPNVLGTMAKCHYLLGNYDDAFACLDVEMVSSTPSSYRELLRGQIHQKLGQMEAAKSCWQKGVQFNETNIFHDQLIQKLKLLDE